MLGAGDVPRLGEEADPADPLEQPHGHALAILRQREIGVVLLPRPVGIVFGVEVAVMSKMVLAIPVQGEQKQPGQQLPCELVPSSVAEQAVVRGIVHEDSERVETNPDQGHREEVHERVARGFGEPRGEDDHGQVQRKVAQGTPRVDSELQGAGSGPASTTLPIT